MDINDFEKCVLSAIFQKSSTDLPKKITSELYADRFGSTAHKLIYRAIGELIQESIQPTPVNVSMKLNGTSETVGGIEYLESLTGFLNLLGTESTDGIRSWVNMIDNAGRLRHFGEVLHEYKGYYDDFERLVKEVEDVDGFLSNFLDKVNKGAIKNNTSYKPIGTAVEKARQRISEGDSRSDLIPSGLSSLYKYHIPRPSTLGAILGLSSSGKTSLALSLVMGTAIYLKREGIEGHCSINSLETSDYRIALTMAGILSGVSSSLITEGNVPQDIMKKFEAALDYIEGLPIVYDDNPFINTEELMWEATASHVTTPRILGVSDYAELFTDKENSEELRVSKIVKNHRRLAWRLGSCEILLSQFSNEANRSMSKVGELSNARYSGAFEQVIDWGGIVYNPKQMRIRQLNFTPPEGYDENKAYFILQKNKNYSPGVIPFDWQPECMRFQDMSLSFGELYEGFKPGNYVFSTENMEEAF